MFQISCTIVEFQILYKGEKISTFNTENFSILLVAHYFNHHFNIKLNYLSITIAFCTIDRLSLEFLAKLFGV